MDTLRIPVKFSKTHSGLRFYISALGKEELLTAISDTERDNMELAKQEGKLNQYLDTHVIYARINDVTQLKTGGWEVDFEFRLQRPTLYGWPTMASAGKMGFSWAVDTGRTNQYNWIKTNLRQFTVAPVPADLVINSRPSREWVRDNGEGIVCRLSIPPDRHLVDSIPRKPRVVRKKKPKAQPGGIQTKKQTLEVEAAAVISQPKAKPVEGKALVLVSVAGWEGTFELPVCEGIDLVTKLSARVGSRL